MTRRLLAALIVYVVTWVVLLHVDFPDRPIWLLSVATTQFALVVVMLARSQLDRHATALLILGAAALMQVVALTTSPLTSDDAFRYAWDAKVQLSGTDPYHYSPAAPQLERLRDASLFGPSSPCTYSVPGGCTAINRPFVHTIYPPVAQSAFVAGRLMSYGGSGGLLVYQFLAALGVLVISALLLQRARKHGTPAWPVALWAWSPVAVLEFGNNAHIDWLAVLLTVLAVQAGARAKHRTAGILLGAAIATKIYPALALLALMRRRPWLVGFTAAATVLLVYVPHVLAVGRQVIGYLPGYLRESGYDSGRRLVLVGSVLPHPVDTVVAAAILTLAGCYVWRRSDPAAPEHAATVLTGVAFLVVAPSYGWYAAILIALAVMSARYEWIVLALAPSFVYLTGLALLFYVLGALGTALGWWWRCSSATGRSLPAIVRTRRARSTPHTRASAGH